MIRKFLETSETFLPQFLGAVIAFCVGYFLARVAAALVRNFLNKIRLNQLFKRLGWEELLERFNIKMNFSVFFGELVSWFIIILFLMASTDLVGLLQFSRFLEKVLDYFPNIFIASLIFIIAAYLVDFTYKIFLVTGKEDKLIYSKFLGIGIRRTIWILVALAILYQLGIAKNLVLSVFIAILALVVLAAGIAFGLGGRDLAKKILEEFKERIS